MIVFHMNNSDIGLLQSLFIQFHSFSLTVRCIYNYHFGPIVFKCTYNPCRTAGAWHKPRVKDYQLRISMMSCVITD